MLSTSWLLFALFEGQLIPKEQIFSLDWVIVDARSSDQHSIEPFGPSQTKTLYFDLTMPLQSLEVCFQSLSCKAQIRGDSVAEEFCDSHSC